MGRRIWPTLRTEIATHVKWIDAVDRDTVCVCLPPEAIWFFTTFIPFEMYTNNEHVIGSSYWRNRIGFQLSSQKCIAEEYMNESRVEKIHSHICQHTRPFCLESQQTPFGVRTPAYNRSSEHAACAMEWRRDEWTKTHTHTHTNDVVSAWAQSRDEYTILISLRLSSVSSGRTFSYVKRTVQRFRLSLKLKKNKKIIDR